VNRAVPFPIARWLIAASALIGVVGPAAGAPLPSSTKIAWDAARDGARKTYRVGALTLTFSAGRSNADGTPPVLTVDSPKFGRTSVAGAASDSPLTATAVIAPLDPEAGGPSVIFHSPTGEAHGGTHLDILDPVGGRWRRVNAGDWSGDFTVNPQRAANGGAYLQLYDEAFHYAFACYACAGVPPRIFTLVGGRWSDASADPLYAPVFRAAAAEDKKDCDGGDGGGQNGACALYVAEAARIGQFDPAWAYMLAHYDKTDRWDWPTRCTVPRVADACPKGREIVFKTYPEALRNFLAEHGYIAPKPSH
jgi:hypothetical protein